MKNWNPNLDKAALLRHMGSVSQLGGLKRYTFAEGRAKGVEAVDVVTGTGFDFTVLPGRCMDLAWARYKGIPVSYMCPRRRSPMLRIWSSRAWNGFAASTPEC